MREAVCALLINLINSHSASRTAENVLYYIIMYAATR